ncbi:MAG: uracil-DNA glycosylase [Hyphomicrobiaceae bacterium]
MSKTEGDITAEDWQALVGWFEAMGIGDPVADRPTDWFALAVNEAEAVADRPGVAARSPAAAQRRMPAERADAGLGPGRAAPHSARSVTSAATSRQPAAPRADQFAAAVGRDEAASAASLAELGAMLSRFEGCALKATATNLCFYRGAEKARLMLIGEAPGRDEDIAGRPFVGRAGQLLDRMLAAIGLSEAEVHITNIVYWRPPGNRTPTPQEAEACRPFLERQLALVEPEIVVMLGGAAAKHLTGAAEGIMRLRGKWRPLTLGERRIKALATLHPAYLLRTPAAKRLAWQDLLMIEDALAKSPSA